MGLTHQELELLKRNMKDLTEDERLEYKRIKQKVYQKKYRDKLKESKVPKPIKQNEKIIVKSNKKDLIEKKPQWYGKLIAKYPKFKINDANYIAYRAYNEKQVDDFVKKIAKVLKIFNKELTPNTKAIIVSVLRGKNPEHGKYKTNLESFNKELNIFNKKNIKSTLEKIANYFKNINTIKNNITPLVNLFARLDSFETTYQIMTNYNISLNNKYIEKREDNEPTSDEELEKLKTVMASYDPSTPEITKKKINASQLDSKERAIASLYLLMPVRRLEYSKMKLTDTLNSLDENFNYLFIKGKKSMFIFNKFKTKEKGGLLKSEIFGTQNLELNEDVLQYLKEYIKDSKIKSGDFLFKEMSLSTYSKMIQDIMQKIFGISGIGATTMRTVASSYNQSNTNKSVKEKRELAEQMAHDLNTNALYNKITNVKLNRDKQIIKKNKIPLKNDIKLLE